MIHRSLFVISSLFLYKLVANVHSSCMMLSTGSVVVVFFMAVGSFLRVLAVVGRL